MFTEIEIQKELMKMENLIQQLAELCALNTIHMEIIKKNKKGVYK